MIDIINQTTEIMFDRDIIEKIKCEDLKILDTLSKYFSKKMYAISIRQCSKKYTGSFQMLFDLSDMLNNSKLVFTNYNTKNHDNGVFLFCCEISLDTYQSSYDWFNFHSNNYVLLTDTRIQNVLSDYYQQEDNKFLYDNQYVTGMKLLDQLVNHGAIIVRFSEDDELKERIIYCADHNKNRIDEILQKIQ